MRVRVLIFAVLAPFAGQAGRRFLARLILRATVDRSAEIGIAILDATHISISAGARIGHFTVIRNLEGLHLAKDARLGTFNWIFGARGSTHFAERPDRKSVLKLGTGASVTSRHILDCTDTIEIGAFATLAGFRSQILTHSIDVACNRQTCEPVQIGAHSFLGTGVILLKGARFPPRSVLAAGSVFSSRHGAESMIYGGVPAKAHKPLDPQSGYLTRTEARVS